MSTIELFQGAYDETARTDIAAHTANMSNPHQLTVPFAQLPAVSIGATAVCTDSDTDVWGALITGGAGPYTVIAAKGPTGWTVVGKLL